MLNYLKQRQGDIILALTAIVWGAGFPSTKYLYHSFLPLPLLTLRFLGASILLTLLFFNSLKNLTFIEFKKAVVIGTVLALALIFIMIGLNYSDASTAGFLIATSIVWVPVFERLFYRKPISKTMAASIIIAIIGIYLITDAHSHHVGIGDFIILLSAIFFSWQIILIDRLSPLDNPAIATIQFYVVTLISFVFTVLSGKWQLPHSMNLPTTLNLVFLTVVVTGFAFWAQTKFQHKTTAVKASFLFLLEPICSMIFSYWFLSEIITSKAVLGSVVILMGILLLFKKTQVDTLKNPLNESDSI